MTAIYNRIIEQLNKRDVSSKELARILNLKKSPLTDWKNHKSKPTLEQIIKICENFAISADYLLFGQHTFLTSDEATIIEHYHNMSETDQEDFLLIAEMKANKGKRNQDLISSPSVNDETFSETA